MDINYMPDSIGKSRFIKLSCQDTERPDLGNARVVITGGRGLKSAENFKMIDKLAEKLGAAGNVPFGVFSYKFITPSENFEYLLPAFIIA